MKNNILTIIAALLVGQLCGAQNLSEILSMVETGNPALAAASMDVQADRQKNLTEAALQDVEIEFNYLWGQDREIGNRHDFRVTQSFDLASLTGTRHRQAEAQTELSDLEYKALRRELLLEASQVCMELVYLEGMIEQTQRHLSDSKDLHQATARKVELGEETVLELNKARLHQTSVEGELESLLLERTLALGQLASLCGRQSISFDASSFVPSMLPLDFDLWYAQAAADSPVLQYVRKTFDVDTRQLSIEKAAALPSLNLGYMSELGLTDRYRGLTVGVSIPLWSNTRKVKEADARRSASQLRVRDTENRFLMNLSGLFAKAQSQARLSSSLRSALEQTDNRSFLLEAQKSGEISMLDYLQEMDLYYEALRQCLEAEKDYNLSVVELDSYSL